MLKEAYWEPNESKSSSFLPPEKKNEWKVDRLLEGVSVWEYDDHEV